jgi:uncharacterized protein
MGALAAAALVAGLLGGVHCVGMCGGIAGALSAAARGPALRRQVAFNTGRIASYALGGALAGGLGSLVQAMGPVNAAQTALFIVANIFMVLLGLYVAGWGRALLRLESAGGGVWRRLAPLRQRFLPIDSDLRALGAGAVWGWIPCGLVYSMLALALASGSAASGAAVLAAFGLGTLPAMLGAGLAAQKLFEVRRNPWVRRGAGVAIIGLAIVGFARVPALQELAVAGWVCLQPS